MRRSKPGSSGWIRVNINGLLHLEQGGRRLSTNLKSRGSITVRISQRLCGRNSESIPQSKTGHCEIQIRPLVVKAGQYRRQIERDASRRNTSHRPGICCKAQNHSVAERREGVASLRDWANAALKKI